MEDTLRKLTDRTDDVSELETNMSGVQWKMKEDERKLETVSNSLKQLTEGNVERDNKLDALLACFTEGMDKREKKTEEKIENKEKASAKR